MFRRVDAGGNNSAATIYSTWSRRIARRTSAGLPSGFTPCRANTRRAKSISRPKFLWTFPADENDDDVVQPTVALGTDRRPGQT